MHKSFLVTAALAGLAAASLVPARADVVTALSGGTTYTFGRSNYRGAETQTIAPGITWSSTNTENQMGSVFGYDGGYGFAGNGYWNGTFSMIGLNDSFGAYRTTDSMTIAFDAPVRSVGSFLNYDPDLGDTPIIAVYDSGHNLIESYGLDFRLDGDATNGGAFYGFLEATADISYITYSNAYVGAADLVVNGTAAAVPEPVSLTLFVAGLLGVGLLRRRRRR
jgi:hypothetical protein